MATAKQKRGATPSTAARKKSAPSPESLADAKREAKRIAREAKRAAFFERRAAIEKQVKESIVRTADSVHACAGELPDFKRGGWTEELGTRLGALIITGLSMEKISHMPGMPDLSTMLYWLGDTKHPFGEIYRTAKDRMVPFLEEKAYDIAMSPQVGEIIVERDSEELGQTIEVRKVDAVERSKLAVATIQWTLSHLKPKKHGRNADPEAGKPNDQLKALFQALNEGPVD